MHSRGSERAGWTHFASLAALKRLLGWFRSINVGQKVKAIFIVVLVVGQLEGCFDDGEYMGSGEGGAVRSG